MTSEDTTAMRNGAKRHHPGVWLGGNHCNIATLVLIALIFIACKQSRPVQATDGGLLPVNEAPPRSTSKSWGVSPTRLDDIRTDPTTYLEHPVLVYVGVKPCDYFNYGYRKARNSHFCFEMVSLVEATERDCKDDCLVGDVVYGYADRSWARPFFDEVKKVIKGDDGISASATLWVAYKRNRYNGDTAEHIEILAAAQGRAPDLALPTSTAPSSNDVTISAAGDCDPKCIDGWMAAVSRGCVTKSKVCSSLTLGAMLDCVEKSGVASTLYPELIHGDFSSVGAIVRFVSNTRKRYGCPVDPTEQKIIDDGKAEDARRRQKYLDFTKKGGSSLFNTDRNERAGDGVPVP